MNADDYKKLKDIFQAAVELPPEERAAYLDEKCDGNVELRSEVERLIDALDDEFLERPAVEPISSPVISSVSLSGQRVGHYNVIRKIGSGGMGDVYLATDGKLGRRVAVKILPEEFTSEQDRLDRFQLEARAASALSHPNILTIHEIGEWAGTHYIATEYVEGETLRHRISRERLSVPETLEVGVQLVSAIAAAHEAGICHRDIKPENIMIRRDGIIKVVDFGLVKLTPSLLRGNPARPTSAGDPTVKIVRTEPGVIMGTVQYMSPEQTRSLPTDERSDIWSLGCVLYEMLAGRAPFEGENSADLIAEIVKTHPAPLSSLNPDVPERLDEIVGKALEKNPDERYQTAKDLLIDLKRLKRRFDVDVELERSQPRITTSEETVISGPNIISTKKGPKDLTEVNSAQYLYWGMKAHRWTAIGIALLIIGLVGGTALLVRYYWVEPIRRPMAFATNDLSRITNNGRSSDPAITRDGKQIAYAITSNGLTRIVIRQVTSDNELELMPPKKTEGVIHIRFSNEGDFVYFVRSENGLASLYRVPSLGGTERKLLDDVDSNVSFSPDGKNFAFIRHSIEAKTSSLIVSTVSGSDQTALATRRGFGSFIDVAWSPDHDRLMVSLGDEFSTSFFETRSRFATVSISSGETIVVNEKVWIGANHVNWLNDGSGILFVARNEETRRSSVWHMSYPEGEITQLTNHPDSYPNISAISENRSIGIERVINEASFWSLHVASKKVEQLRGESPEQLGRNGWVNLNDGTLLVTKFEPDASNFWMMSAALDSETKITDENSHNYHPSLSPDGRYIVFVSTRTGKPRIWRSDVDGKNPVQLSKSDGGAETYPRVLRDNKTVLFVRDIPGAWQTALMKITLAGDGEETVFSEDHTAISMPSISPNGKRLAYWSMSYPENGEPRQILKISDLDGGNIRPTSTEVAFPKFGYPLFPCAWGEETKLVCVSSRDTSNLFSLSFDGGVRKLTDFREGTIYNPTFLNNGKQVLFSRHFTKSDIYLLKERLYSLAQESAF